MKAHELELRRRILETDEPCEAARDYAKWLEGEGRLDDAARVVAAALAQGPSWRGELSSLTLLTDLEEAWGAHQRSAWCRVLVWRTSVQCRH
jgi:hypothetical protein